MKTDIQTILSQMADDELDFVQREIRKIKDQREKDELKQIVSEINSLLTKLQAFRSTITVNSWVSEYDSQSYVEIDLLDLIESLREFI